jgi:hypothetical protein
LLTCSLLFSDGPYCSYCSRRLQRTSPSVSSRVCLGVPCVGRCDRNRMDMNSVFPDSSPSFRPLESDAQLQPRWHHDSILFLFIILALVRIVTDIYIYFICHFRYIQRSENVRAYSIPVFALADIKGSVGTTMYSSHRRRGIIIFRSEYSISPTLLFSLLSPVCFSSQSLRLTLAFAEPLSTTPRHARSLSLCPSYLTHSSYLGRRSHLAAAILATALNNV